jgi:hypothetical protein
MTMFRPMPGRKSGSGFFIAIDGIGSIKNYEKLWITNSPAPNAFQQLHTQPGRMQ